MFSVAVGSQGDDAAPTVTPSNTVTGLTANTTTLVVVPDAAGSGTSVTTSGPGTPTGMTIEFRTDGTGNLLTPVRILNMGSGFSYGDVITIPDGILGGTTGGSCR